MPCANGPLRKLNSSFCNALHEFLQNSLIMLFIMSDELFYVQVSPTNSFRVVVKELKKNENGYRDVSFQLWPS